MRRPRIKADGEGYYHAMSRIIERRYIIGEKEKRRLLGLMRSLAGFGGLEILTYTLLDNHFHVLVYVPERQEMSDEELLRRLAFILGPEQVERIGQQMAQFRKDGQEAAAERLKAHYTYRMHSISEFFKALKQRFSQAYNVREGRKGPLWEQRFKSVLVEGKERALVTMAAYIDLNAVRAGLVKDPKDYRYSGYGDAVAGGKEAREGLRRLVQAARGGGGRVSWGRAQAVYRQQLYVQGQKKEGAEGKAARPGFTAEQVRAVIESGGRLPMHEVLRCRVRYFSDGLALGGQEFLQGVFERYRGHFGPRRRTGPRPMRYGEWGELFTLRDLRLQAVCRA